jgi:hypothetical protein
MGNACDGPGCAIGSDLRLPSNTSGFTAGYTNGPLTVGDFAAGPGGAAGAGAAAVRAKLDKRRTKPALRTLDRRSVLGLLATGRGRRWLIASLLSYGAVLDSSFPLCATIVKSRR